MEKKISFINNNLRLNGVLNIPTNSPEKIGVIFLHGWGTYRIGPHRIFVNAAREFEKLGIPSLRFDFRGRGESEGETSNIRLVDMIDDTTVAINTMIKESGVKEIILLGLCSGGEVAVGSALSNPAVEGLILWSTPLLARESDVASDTKKTATIAKSYWQKLFMAETWKKLARNNVNYRLIFKIIFGGFLSKPEKTLKEKELLELFKTFKGEALFVYGSNDPDTKFNMNSYSKLCDENNISSKFCLIDGANHNFYSLNWKKELLNISSEWIVSNYVKESQWQYYD